MANACGIRIRLKFQTADCSISESYEIEKCWYFVDFSKFESVKHLRRKIRNQFRLKNVKVSLYIDDYLLISELPIKILRDNDIINVRLSRRECLDDTVRSNDEHEAEEIQTPESKRERRKRKASEEPQNFTKQMQYLPQVIPITEVEIQETKKKRRRKRKIKTSTKLVEEMENIDSKDKTIFVSKRTNLTGKHTRFDCDGNELDVSEVESDSKSVIRVQDAKKFDEEEIAQSLIKKLKVNGHPKCKLSLLPAVDGTTSFDQYPLLVGPPRVGDLIAYKELVLSSDYTPQVSSYQIAKVMSILSDNIVLHVINKSQTPKLNGKFEVYFDDENEENDVREVESEHVVVTLASLIEPRLVNNF